MESAMRFLNEKAWLPISAALKALWTDVAVPFWDLLVKWGNEKAPVFPRFWNFCFNLFKLKFSLRVLTFMVMLPVALFAVLTVNRKRRRRNGRRKK